jgi:hypothetical protein
MVRMKLKLIVQRQEPLSLIDSFNLLPSLASLPSDVHRHLRQSSHAAGLFRGESSAQQVISNFTSPPLFLFLTFALSRRARRDTFLSTKLLAPGDRASSLLAQSAERDESETKCPCISCSDSSMMKRVVCDVTSLPPSLLLVPAALFSSARCSILTKDTQSKRRVLPTTMVRQFPSPPFTNIHTPAFMMKYYLDVNFYSTFPRAQNHADNSLLPSF